MFRYDINKSPIIACQWRDARRWDLGEGFRDDSGKVVLLELLMLMVKWKEGGSLEERCWIEGVVMLRVLYIP